MHKDLNCVKGGNEAMMRWWEKNNEQGPILLANQDNAAVIQQAEPLVNRGEYAKALEILTELKGPIDLFFDKVMVMVEDESVRANRLALLQRLLKEFSTIADFSEITEGEESPK